MPGNFHSYWLLTGSLFRRGRFLLVQQVLCCRRRDLSQGFVGSRAVIALSRGLCSRVLCNQFSLETDNRVWIGDHGLCVVLGLIARTTRLPRHHERSFPATRPVCRAFARDSAVRDESLCMGNLMCRRLADYKVRVVRRQVVLLVRIN